VKRGTTLFLKLAVILIGLPILALCVIGLPSLIKDAIAHPWDLNKFLFPIIAGMYVTAVPFFYALYQAMILLGYIDKSKAFSHESVASLNRIKWSALVISAIYMMLMPLFFLIGDLDDAPGVVVLGMVFTFAPAIVAVFAAVLQRLLKEAIEIKSENELTV
jgi:hypothetical protein